MLTMSLIVCAPSNSNWYDVGYVSLLFQQLDEEEAFTRCRKKQKIHVAVCHLTVDRKDVALRRV